MGLSAAFAACFVDLWRSAALTYPCPVISMASKCSSDSCIYFPCLWGRSAFMYRCSRLRVVMNCLGMCSDTSRPRLVGYAVSMSCVGRSAFMYRCLLHGRSMFLNSPSSRLHTHLRIVAVVWWLHVIASTTEG